MSFRSNPTRSLWVFLGTRTSLYQAVFEKTLSSYLDICQSILSIFLVFYSRRPHAYRIRHVTLNKLYIYSLFVSIALALFSWALVSFLWDPSLEKNTVPVGDKSNREKRTPECNVNVLWRNDHLLATHSLGEGHPNAFVVRPLNFATIWLRNCEDNFKYIKMIK